MPKRGGVKWTMRVEPAVEFGGCLIRPPSYVHIEAHPQDSLLRHVERRASIRSGSRQRRNAWQDGDGL